MADDYVASIDSKEQFIRDMNSMVDEGLRILSGKNDIRDFGDLLHQAWLAKRSLSSSISNENIDALYGRGKMAGAVGGKITGAGGGGFLLLFVPPEKQSSVREALSDLLWIPFHFEFNGSQIIFYDPRVDDFKHIADEREERDLRCFMELSELNALQGVN